jgi:hypothetical protein
MLQIRQGVFETNSSSTHAISVCSKADWDMLQRGEAMIDYNLNILPNDQAMAKNEELRKEAEKHGWDPDDYVMDSGYVAWDEFTDRSDYEFYVNHSTIGGVDVVVFGYYGYDY